MKSLQAPYFGGTTFHWDNDIQPQIHKRRIKIHDKHISLQSNEMLPLLSPSPANAKSITSKPTNSTNPSHMFLKLNMIPNPTSLCPNAHRYFLYNLWFLLKHWVSAVYLLVQRLLSPIWVMLRHCVQFKPNPGEYKPSFLFFLWSSIFLFLFKTFQLSFKPFQFSNSGNIFFVNSNIREKSYIL